MLCGDSKPDLPPPAGCIPNLGHFAATVEPEKLRQNPRRNLADQQWLRKKKTRFRAHPKQNK
jgi:hypothetical protein